MANAYSEVNRPVNLLEQIVRTHPIWLVLNFKLFSL